MTKIVQDCWYYIFKSAKLLIQTKLIKTKCFSSVQYNVVCTKVYNTFYNIIQIILCYCFLKRFSRHKNILYQFRSHQPQYILHIELKRDKTDFLSCIVWRIQRSQSIMMAGMLEDYKSKYFQIVRRDFHSPRIWYIATQIDKFISQL